MNDILHLENNIKGLDIGIENINNKINIINKKCQSIKEPT